MDLQKSLKFSFLSFFLLLCITMPANFYGQEYGLRFNGQKHPLDKRTGLNVTPKEFVSAEKEFELSFDLKLNAEERRFRFGYILRVINKKGKNIDLIFSADNKEKLIIVIGDTETTVLLEDFKRFSDDWLKIDLKFLLVKKKLIFSINGNQLLQKTVAFKNKEDYKIFFGANKYDEFSTTDVANMSIRDIKLKKNGKTINHYPLKQCEGNNSLDIFSSKKIQIANPNWILCEHQKWKLNFESKIQGLQLVTANEEKGELYFLNNTHFLTYNLKNNAFKKTPYHKDTINLTLDFRLVYRDHKIYCYHPDKKVFSILDLKSAQWSDKSPFIKGGSKRKFQKHNSIFDIDNNAIYTLGGYGHYQYNNIVNRLDINTGIWSLESQKDTIFKPRYLAGSSILNDSIYIFGGYGSATGSQHANPKSYFNLLAYNTKTKQFKEKFKVKKHIKDMIVSANNLWINKKNRDFYALISDKVVYDGYLKLIKGNLDKPQTAILGDSIPYKFLDIKSFSNLYYFSKEKKLIAYTSYINKNKLTEFSIYSIAFPVISIPVKAKQNYFHFNNYLYLILFSIVLFGLFLYFKRQKKPKLAKKTAVTSLETNKITTIDFTPVKNNSDYKITFFGGFQAINQEQKDITNKFSPLLKELFLLIWMHTFKNNKGISSKKLIEILWYDKSTRSAQNNRSVNITKLKSLIKQLGGSEITKETGYWKIDYDYKELKTDYYELIQITRNKKSITRKRIDHLIKITQKGAFLFNLDYEWLEPFKQDISDSIIDALITFAESFDIKSDPDFIISLCDCVFNFDSINEEAVICKCKAYNYKGNHSMAETTFKKFQKEYKLLYAQDFEYSFQEVLENKN